MQIFCKEFLGIKKHPLFKWVKVCYAMKFLMFCVIHSTNLPIASTDDHALWGDASRRYGSLRLYNGDSRRGSEVKTSSAAARITPPFSASAKSCSFTMPPRATFIIIADGFIIDSSSFVIKFRVYGN